eukprot:126566-Lingulodinium_polyedra.AAC.1
MVPWPRPAPVLAGRANYRPVSMPMKPPQPRAPVRGAQARPLRGFQARIWRVPGFGLVWGHQFRLCGVVAA